MLRDALMELTADHGYEAVTVSAISERAMVNRATFYRYYEGKEDLLLRGLDELYDSFVDAAPPEPAGDRASPAALVESLRFIRAHSRFYQRMLGSDGDSRFADRMRRYHRSIIAPRVERFLKATSKDESELEDSALQPIIDTAVGAFEGTVLGWLGRDCSDDEETVAAHCLEGVAAVLRSLTWRSHPTP
jgi:AcrR family transcriptional regulator